MVTFYSFFSKRIMMKSYHFGKKFSSYILKKLLNVFQSFSQSDDKVKSKYCVIEDEWTDDVMLTAYLVFRNVMSKTMFRETFADVDEEDLVKILDIFESTTQNPSDGRLHHDDIMKIVKSKCVIMNHPLRYDTNLQTPPHNFYTRTPFNSPIKIVENN